MTIAALRELLTKAVPPWSHRGSLPYNGLRVIDDGTVEIIASTVNYENAALIVVAINALPALLDVVDAANDAYYSLGPHNFESKRLGTALKALDTLK